MFSNTHATVGQSQGSRVLSALKNPRQSRGLLDRTGLSLTEVLISMGILTVGLLGVASVFPVASFYMQKGDVADRGSAIAQAAFNEVISNGMLNPERWLMFQPTSTAPEPERRWTYSRRFAESLRNELTTNYAGANTLPVVRGLNQRYGSIYVIDPIGANTSSVNPSVPADRRQVHLAQRLPINALLTSAEYTGYSHWWPWNPAGAQAQEAQWPVMRVSFEEAPGTFSPWPMTRVTAEKLFSSTDDLAIDMPPQADRPSVQRWDTNDLNNDSRPDPLARQSRGDYSWIATIAPPSTIARNALVTNVGRHEYEVSVAVFHKRILDDAAADNVGNLGERLTKAKVVSTGLNGGELLIEKMASDPSTDPFRGLKVGNWVPVCGPNPASTNENPRFVFRWYRVLAIEKEAPGIITNQATQRLVSLRGPQWPWQPATNLTVNHLSNNICLAIVPNVVAVHAKTVQLEGNSAWSMQ